MQRHQPLPGRVLSLMDGGVWPPEAGEVTLGEFKDELITSATEAETMAQYTAATGGVTFPSVVIERPRGADDRQRKRARRSVLGVLWSKLVGGGPSGSDDDGDGDDSKLVEYGDDEEEDDEDDEFTIIGNDEKGSPIINPRRREERGPQSSRRRRRRQSQDDVVCGFAWHPFLPKWAVCAGGEVVRVFDLLRKEPGTGELLEEMTLTHQFQTGVTCCQWSPMGGHVLAVGCANGVCLWRFVKGRSTSSAWMTWLAYGSHRDVAAVEFSPCGRYLASSTRGSTTVVIWDVLKGADSGTPLVVPGISGVSLLRWSPSGRFLFAATTGRKRVLWETSKAWAMRVWEAASPCLGACWGSDGMTLVLAQHERLNIVTLADTMTNAHICIDVSLHKLRGQADGEEEDDEEDECYDDELAVGGTVRDVAWSPSSERLAVAFEETEYVALFAVQPDLTAFSAHPVGFIKGPPDAGRPRRLSFRPSYDRGALLGIAWESGLVATTPLFFEK